MATTTKYTYRINRLSNPDLELGLKTGAIFTGSSSNITVSKILQYTTDPAITESSSDLVLTNKGYVDSIVEDLTASLDSHLATFITSYDSRIIVTPTNPANGLPTVQLKLNTVYANGAIRQFGYMHTASDNTTEDPGTLTGNDYKDVIIGIDVNQYGIIQKVTKRKLSTADLDNSGTFDNYKNWQIKVGETTDEVESSNVASGVTVKPLTFIAGNGLNIALDNTGSAPSVTFSPKLVATGAIEATSTGMNLKSLNSTVTDALKKITVDTYGRITDTTAVAFSDLPTQYHSATTYGFVAAKTDSSIETAVSGELAGTTGTYFYTSTGNWATIPFNRVARATASGTTGLQLLLAATTGTSVTSVSSSSLTFVPDSGTLSATNFVGNGASLTNLSFSGFAANSHLPEAMLPSAGIDVSNLKALTSSSSVVTDASGKLTTISNPSNNTDITAKDYVLTKHLAAVTGTGTTVPQWTDIKSLVTDIVAGEGGMQFKGVWTTASDAPTTGFKKGDFYKVANAMTFNGISLESGDTIIAIADYDSAYASASTVDKAGYWTPIQGNLVDTVTFSSSALTTGVLAIKSTGTKIITDGITATLTNSKWNLTNTNIDGVAAKATQLETSRTLWGQGFNGTANVSGDISSTGNITPALTNTSTIGTADLKYSNIFATTFTGSLSGNATSADKVNTSLTIKNGSSVLAEFDGSEAKEVNVAPSAIGAATTVAIATATGSGNTITALSAAKAADGTVTITPTKGITALTDVTSSIFSITGTTSKAIALLTSEAAGAIYNSAVLPTLSGNYGFGGVLTAYNLKVKKYGDSNSVSVAEKGLTSESGYAANRILISKTQGSEYGFTASTYQVSTSGSTSWTSDTNVPTAAAVKSYADTLSSNTIAGADKTIKITATGTATASTTQIPANSFIKEIRVRVDTAYDTGYTASIKVGSVEYVASDEIDLSVGDTAFVYAVNKDLAAAGTLQLSFPASTGTAGAMSIYATYVQAQS